MSETNYAVVGCSNCDALWVVGDLRDQDTAACPSCGHTRDTDRLRALKEADDHAVACELRSRMLAARAVSNPTHDGYENLDERDQYATLAEQVDDYFATDENLYAEQIETTTEREEIVAEAADRAVEAHFEQFEYDVDTSWREEFGEAADRVAGCVVDDVPRQAGAGSFEVVDHQPLDTTATLRLDDNAPSETWQTLADDAAFRDALLSRARDVVRDARPAQYADTLVEAGVTAMDGAFARVLTTALGGDESALSAALSAFGKGGVVEEIGVPAPSLDAVRDGPLALFALDDADDTATVSVRIEPAFADRRADQRRALFELVEALADVVDVRLAVADDETMRWLLGEHAGDLPADVSEMCKEWLHTDNPASRKRVGGALGDLEPDAPAVTTLRRIADAPGEARTYGSLYEQETDFPAGEGSENDTQEKAAQRVRTHLKRLRDHDLVTEGYQTNQGRAVAVTSTGLAFLSALRRVSGALPEMPVAADPPQNSPDMPCKPAQAREGGEEADQAADRSGGRSAPQESEATSAPADNHSHTTVHPGFLSRHRQEALLSAAHDGEVALVDARFDELPHADPRQPLVGVDRRTDTVLCSLSYRNPMQAAATTAVALTSDQLLSQVGETLSERLGSGFESVPSLNILRNGRCLGWLSNETAEDGPGAFLEELRKGRQTLYDLLRDLYHEEYHDRDEFRGVITRFAHGLAGTALHLLEMAGFRVVRELITPEFTRHYGEEGNPDQRRDLAKFLATSAAIQSRYGHFTTYRQLFEDREDKKDQALRPDVDLADPFGAFCGGLVLSGDGVEGFADDLGDALSRPAERVAEAPEFAVDIPVRCGTTPEQTAEAVERMLDSKAIESTDEAAAMLHGLARSVFGVCEALSTLGTEEWRRRVHLDEVRVALSSLDETRLLAKGSTPTQRAGLAALLSADEPVSQAELGRRGNFSSQSWRDNRDVLVAAGLVRRTDDGRWRACLPFDSERELAIEVERGADPEDVDVDQEPADQEASIDATWQGLPWFVSERSTRAGDFGRDRRRPTDVLFEIVLDVGADTPQNAPEAAFMESFYGPEPPGQDVVTAFLDADESGLAGIWPLIEAGCALRDDPEPAVARMGDRPAQRAISDGGFSE